MVGTQVTLEQMAWLLSPQNETVNPSSKKAHQCHLVSIRVLGKVNELLVYDCWKPPDDWAFACWPTQQQDNVGAATIPMLGRRARPQRLSPGNKEGRNLTPTFYNLSSSVHLDGLAL